MHIKTLTIFFADLSIIESAAVNMHLPSSSTLLQYVDDILVASPTESDCIKDSTTLLKHLAVGGNRASLANLTFCQPAVNYFGYVSKYLSPNRVKTLKVQSHFWAL